MFRELYTLKTAETYKCYSEYEVIDCYYTVKTCLMLGEEIEESGEISALILIAYHHP